MKDRDSTERLFYLGVGPLAAIVLGMALVPLRDVTTASNFTFVFLVLTIVVAEFGGRGPALATALVSALSLDFFLTQPYLRLSIEAKDDIIAFVGLAVCGLVAAALGSPRSEGTLAAPPGGRTSTFFMPSSASWMAALPWSLSSRRSCEPRGTSCRWPPPSFGAKTGPSSPAAIPQAGRGLSRSSCWRPNEAGAFRKAGAASPSSPGGGRSAGSTCGGMAGPAAPSHAGPSSASRVSRLSCSARARAATADEPALRVRSRGVGSSHPAMTDERPDPDALLRRLEAERAPSRGRLKVFFGASPGVGKTYAMLEAARAKQREGADVVIGWVETHGRAETAALTEGLERLPARELEYRGVKLTEFDLDAALARKPDLLLLDELAHTNAPGARHAKRWQDVEELRDAGINVYTTLNVQHLESLNDLVNRVTGVVVRETVPDRVLDAADEVEFIDLPPEELLKRLDEGKVYLPERAAQAVRSFFRRGNLLALRELALRRTAEHVDADVQDYRRDHEIAADLAGGGADPRLRAPEPRERPPRARGPAHGRPAEGGVDRGLRGEPRAAAPLGRRAAGARRARSSSPRTWGRQTATLSGVSVADALLAFARERNVSRIVVGKPLHSRWRDRLKGSLLDEIVRGQRRDRGHGDPGRARRLLHARSAAADAGCAAPRQYLSSAGVVLLSTLVCWAMHERFDKSNLVMVYLLGVAVRGHPLRAAAFRARRRAQRRRLRLLLRASLPDLRGQRHPVPDHLRGHAAGEPPHQHPGRAGEGPGGGRPLAGAADAGALLAEPRPGGSTDRGGGGAGGRAPRVGHPPGSGRRVPARMQQGRLPPPSAGRRPPDGAGARGRAVGLRPRPAGGPGRPTPCRGRPPPTSRCAARGPCLGVLGVRPADALLPLAPDQMDLLEALAQQAASGLERVRLAEEAEARGSPWRASGCAARS